MKIRYRISLEDYSEAQKLMCKLVSAYSPVSATIILLVLCALIFLYFAYSPQSSPAWYFSLPVIAILLFYLIVCPIMRQFKVKKSYRDNPAFQRDIAAELTEERFSADDGAGATSSSTWDHFDRFLEGKRVFVFGGPSKVFTILSKATMTPDELAYVRATLQNRIQRQPS